MYQREYLHTFLSSLLKHSLLMLQMRNWSDRLVQAAFHEQLGFP